MHFPTVQHDGIVTHVLVPVEEFERLTGGKVQQSGEEAGAGVSPPSAAEVAEAVRVLESPQTEWHDAEGVLWQIVRDGLGAVRRQRGLTQEELASMLGVSQPHVSRLERSLDGVTIRALRRIAELLAGHRGQSGGEPEAQGA